MISSGSTRFHYSLMLRTAALLSLFMSVVMAGCAQPYMRPQEMSSEMSLPLQAVEPDVSLEGTWEYEESGQTILITLDKHGNGSYRWKDGKFMTTSCSNGVWKGWWSQRGNDRDGQFEVKLATNGSEGEGRWWYTRIGHDLSPSHRGGSFHIARQNGVDPVIQSGADDDDPFSDRISSRDAQ